MRILLVGSDYNWSIERHFLRHLQAAGIAATLFPAQNLFYDYYYKSILHKILFRVGLSRVYAKINQRLLQLVAKDKPDVIWVFKGMEIYPETLKQLRKEGIRLVNYNPDNPFLFTGKGSGNRNVTNSIGLFDLHLTYDTQIKEQLESQVTARVGLLPFGFEAEDLLPTAAAEKPEICRICFIGTADAQRAAFLHKLADTHPLDLYGANWPRFIKHPNITLHGPVYGKEFLETLRQYRVQLNLMRVHNPESHNMRSFEIPAAGAIGLYPATTDHETFFVKEGIAITYSNLADCALKAGELLSWPAEKAAAFRQRAKERSYANGYSYASRTSQALAYIRELF